MAEIVKLATNVPVELEFKFDSGMTCKSQFGGDQVCYTLIDDRRVYLPASVGRMLEQAGIRAHTPFTLCKREKAVGNRRTIDWELGEPTQRSLPERVPEETAQAPQKSSAVTPEPVPPQHTNGNGANGNGAHPTALQVQLHASILEEVGKRVIDAVAAVEGRAKERGFGDFAFGPENIQKLWVTVYMRVVDGGRR